MEYNEVVPLYADKFFARVGSPTSTGCREWQAGLDKDGYGHFQFRHEGKKYKVRAHRAAYMLAGNWLPPGAILRHTCDNPACVNPEHLLWGTHADNVQDCVSRGRNAFGEGNGRHVMCDDEVLELRASASSFIHEQAHKYGVDEAAIRAALAQRTWTHVP